MPEPVELLIANILNVYAQTIETLPPVLRPGLNRESLAEEIGRRLLCRIAHHARPEIVKAALAVCGVAGDFQTLNNRLTSALDLRAEEAKRFGATTATGAPRSADVGKETADAVASFLRSLFPEANVSIEPASSS